METTSLWRGIKKAREVVLEVVHEFTGGDVQVEFEPKDIKSAVLEKYTDFKKGTVSGQIHAGCPNSPSYRHHSGNHKFYWKIADGKYRLYDAAKDKAV